MDNTVYHPLDRFVDHQKQQELFFHILDKSLEYEYIKKSHYRLKSEFNKVHQHEILIPENTILENDFNASTLDYNTPYNLYLFDHPIVFVKPFTERIDFPLTIPTEHIFFSIQDIILISDIQKEIPNTTDNEYIFNSLFYTIYTKNENKKIQIKDYTRLRFDLDAYSLLDFYKKRYKYHKPNLTHLKYKMMYFDTFESIDYINSIREITIFNLKDSPGYFEFLSHIFKYIFKPEGEFKDSNDPYPPIEIPILDNEHIQFMKANMLSFDTEYPISNIATTNKIILKTQD